MNLSSLKAFLGKNSPTIFTCVSIAGVFSTVWTCHQDTIKDENSKDDSWKTRWKHYIPTAISATTTIGCIAGSHYCSVRQKEALASAYILSQTTLQKYQEKVIERIGKNKERDLREEVVREVAEQKAPQLLYCQGVEDVIETGHGNTLFYDIPGERYFKSDINYLKTQMNDMNADVMTEMYYDWNEINYRWGLPYKKFGKEHVFTSYHLFKPTFVPEMMENGQVRILVDYDLIPFSEYESRKHG